jgi:hypothetical protein
MSISIHQASVPVFIQGLKGLKGVLSKAADLVEAKKWDPDALLKARLYPDMFPLIRQVQIATDFAKGGAARLAGVEVPAWDDVETSFEDLIARIDRAIAYVEGLDVAAFDGAKTVTSSWSAAARPTRSRAWTICRARPCRTSSSTSPPPTRSCATTASRSASATSSARPDP